LIDKAKAGLDKKSRQ